MAKNLQETREMAEFQANLNRIDQFSPLGSLVYGGTAQNPTATQTYSPEMLALLQQQLGGQTAAGNRAQGYLGNLPGGRQPVYSGQMGATQVPQFQAPQFGRGAEIGVGNRFHLSNLMDQNDLNFEQSRQAVEQAQFQRAMSLMNPEFDRQEGRMQQRLANQGLPQASDAYASETGQFMDRRNQATEQAALAAVLAGGGEQSRMLADLLGTSQMGMGQAFANRGQRFDEAMRGYGANLQGQGQQFGQNLQGNQFNLGAAQVNRQIPFQEMMSLFNVGSGMPQQQFQPAPSIGLQSYQSNSVNGPGAGAGIGSAFGALGGAGIGALFGGLPGAQFGSGLGQGFGGAFGSLFG